MSPSDSLQSATNLDQLSAQAQSGQVGRRDFLRRAVALGCSSAVAYQLLGQIEARAQSPGIGQSPGTASNSPSQIPPSNSVTTFAVGEEGNPGGPPSTSPPSTSPPSTRPPTNRPPDVTTYAIGEENNVTTFAIGEENNVTTFAIGEETQSPTTYMTGEEHRPPTNAQPTTQALGEESSGVPNRPNYPGPNYPGTYYPRTYYPALPRPYWRSFRRWSR